MTILLHCGSEEVTRRDIVNVRVPEHTRSYKPVSYGAAIDFMEREAAKLGMDVVSEQYGLNKAGGQMFACLTLDTGRKDDGLSIGLRQSYDKSLALGCAVGSRIFVCDNLVFSGSAFKVVRKNTTNVWRDFQALIRAQIADALSHYTDVTVACDAMKETPCETERGYAALGVMQGRGLLSAQQATVAFGDWRTPRHEAFANRDVWGLYNAVTEGLKKGPPAKLLDRHATAHDFFTENLIAVVMADGEVEHVSAQEAVNTHGIDEGQVGRSMLDDMLSN